MWAARNDISHFMLHLKDLKRRGDELARAHEKLSAQIESLLDRRIRLAGAIQENLHMQERLSDGDNSKFTEPGESGVDT